MNLRKFAIIFLLLSSSFAEAQKYNYALIDSLPKVARWIETDKMQHLYLIENEHSLYKYNKAGELLYSYHENSLGEISSVAVQNPFYILVYYNDYSTAVILDRTLSEIRRQDLSELGIDQLQAIGIASDNHTWLFDNGTATLQKIDAQNQILLESSDLNLQLAEVLTPNRLVEYQNKVYLNSPNLGVLVFDAYANYIKTIPIVGLDYFQVQENQLFFIQEGQFQYYNLQTFQTKAISLPFLDSSIQQISISQNFLFLKKPASIVVVALSKK